MRRAADRTGKSKMEIRNSNPPQGMALLRRAMGILPVPEHGRDGRGTSGLTES